MISRQGTSRRGFLGIVRVTISAPQWRSIPGYEGLYEISDAGAVMSLRKGREMVGGITDTGYRQVSLYDQFGVRRIFYVHRLVLLAFVGPCPEGQEGRHLDCDQTNNTLTNLAYGTRQQNREDSIATGTLSKGSARYNAVIDEATAAEIKRLSATERVTDIASRFGVGRWVVRDIKHGKNWKDVSASRRAA